MGTAVFDPDSLNRLYRYACALTGNGADADDLLQDGLERFLRSGRGTAANPLAYARRTLRNCFIDGLRRRGRFPQEPLCEESTALDLDTRTLEAVAIARDDFNRVWQRLDPFDREILYFWAIEGMTAHEVAQELDSPRGTVLSRIHRLRARLRAELEDAAPPDEGVQTL